MTPMPVDEAWLQGLGEVLVVVPHPDDESIGCGGLLALLAERRVPVTVALLSDGEQSHPGSRRWPAEARAAVRRGELDAALRELGVEPQAVFAFGWPDGALPGAEAPGFDAAVASLTALLASRAPRTLLAPWRRDPHPDHRAASAIARSAIAGGSGPIRLLEYLVWEPERGSDVDRPKEGEVRVVTLELDTAAAVRKARAVAAHRSQHGEVFEDDPQGFMLSPAMRARCAQPRETYLEALGEASLPAAYFEQVYAADPDPWKFETSEYERTKYAATLAALPRPRYHRAFEIGCSIGVLTARLAERCDELLAVDVNEPALARAGERCAAWPQVTLRRMQFPDEVPSGRFDLILVSEVGYYWSRADLARAADAMIERLEPEGTLMLVHWTPRVADYPLTGDAVHACFIELAQAGRLRHLGGERYPQYRLDVFSPA